MNTFYNICIGLSAGIIVGFLLGGLKVLSKRAYTEKQNMSVIRIINKAAYVLKYTTFLLLSLGLVWCVYFLILGTVKPTQADYANNMAELIVSVLTVISIIFAFVEFLRRDDDKKKGLSH